MEGYLQVGFNLDRSISEDVSWYLEDLGAISITIESANDERCFDESTPSEPLWEKQRLSALFLREGGFEDQVAAIEQSIRHIFDGLAEEMPGPWVSEVAKTQLQFDQIADQDWERVWLEGFEPIQVGHRLWVCPSWCEVVEPDHTNLMIDPGLAFGTGTHPTTRLCLEYLSTRHVPGKTVLDFGCGSGILGIAAAKYGAASVVGVDIDERAVSTANENAKLNGVSSTFEAYRNQDLPKWPNGRRFDVVIANILAGTLVDLREDLVSYTAENGVILLSGILQQQTDQVIQSYQNDVGFTIKQMDDWMLLVGKRFAH